MTAMFVPSVQQAARKTTRGPAGRRDGRVTSRQRVIMPGEPSESDVAFARWRGHPGTARTETDRALRLGLIDGVTEVGAAMLELGCWRTRISNLPPGPDLVTALTERPDALAPAPVTDPDEALATAWAARDADVAGRVVTGWANAVLETITARARALSWLQAEQYTDLAMLSRNYPGLAEMLPTEVGFALRTSDAIAGNAINTARTMTTRLPQTLEALRAGLIDSGHAMGLASATSTTTAEVAAAVEADLLPTVTSKGSTITAEQLRRRAVRRVIARDPEGPADRHRTARKDRTMTRWAEEDGMAGLKVLAPAEQIAAIWEAATGLADAAKTPWDPRTLGARRVDSLTDVCLDLLAGMTPAPDRPQPTPATATPAAATPAAAGEPVPGQPDSGQPGHTATTADTESTVPKPGTSDDAAPDTGNVGDTADTDTHAAACNAKDTVDTTSAACADGTAADTTAAACADGTAADTTADDERPTPGRRLDLPRTHGRRPHIQVLVPYQVLLGSNDPCELAGHGAITADQARTIIADGVLQRLLYDPVSGIVLDYGRTRYEPPETLKQFIIARDCTCRTPGCLQPAERCQIDHVEPFRPGKPTGGHTKHTNLDGKCHHHHRAKDGGGFLNTRDPDGTTHWTTPLGRAYTMPPPQIIDPLEQQSAESSRETADLDDQFPAELRRTTNLFLQSGPTTTDSQAKLAKATEGESGPDNRADPSKTTAAAPLEEEPPF